MTAAEVLLGIAKSFAQQHIDFRRYCLGMSPEVIAVCEAHSDLGLMLQLAVRHPEYVAALARIVPLEDLASGLADDLVQQFPISRVAV